MADAALHDREPTHTRLLKADLFGTVIHDIGCATVARDTRAARWWLAPLARKLARREARALDVLKGVAGVPELIAFKNGVLTRRYIAGDAMHRVHPRDQRYFREAQALVRRLHRHRVAHNDLAKEPNWLVTEDGRPALVDFQLATVSRRRGRFFRMLAHDDLRHVLKHKRTYCPDQLSAHERRVLATPSVLSRAWMAAGKPVYLLITRRLLGWSDREGAGDRRKR
jgi:RIO-like serine/threonine protein kinase